MLRHRGSVLLTIFAFVSQLSSEQITYSDGWIPMSHDDVNNQIRRQSTHYPVYMTTKLPNNYDRLNFVENKIHHKNFQGLKEFINENPVERFIEAGNIIGVDQTIERPKEISRKAKKVWEYDNDVKIDNKISVTDINIRETNKDTVNDVIKAAATANTYEVTEVTDKSLSAEDNYTTEYGYDYKPPTNEPENFTSTFYQILSKYNINIDDKLQNYDVSLRNKIQNPPRTAYRFPPPYRFNSLNHLPVDPLLAVFLSNYGFYLPSLYGIKANYNNLYGYLASNNIHNNKPFGLYKIFSDTDSWN